MTSAYITKRTLPPTKTRPKAEARYVVRYRMGGRSFKLRHGGSFRTEREAKERQAFIRTELASGRDPAETLRSLRLTRKRKTFAEWTAGYEKDRLDIGEQTRKSLQGHLKRILPTFGEADPSELTLADVQEWVAEQSVELKPSSLKRYLATLRLILDYADVEPNPARDRRLRLPQVVGEEINPPTAEHVLAMLRIIPKRSLLPLIVAEQTAMRVGELGTLEWGDVDAADSRFRLRSRETKTKRSRWVDVPRWLMEEIEATLPREDRTPERRVFQGFTADVAKNAMARACKTAGIPHYHPHDLRHRRISLWHMSGLPGKVAAERAGHTRASMSIDVYSHVMPLEEIPVEAFVELLGERTRVGVVA